MTVTLTLARGLQAAYLDVPNPKQAGYLKAVEAATANTARDTAPAASPAENEEAQSSAIRVLKHHAFRGKYERLLYIADNALQTVDPSKDRVTNTYAIEDVDLLEDTPTEGHTLRLRVPSRNLCGQLEVLALSPVNPTEYNKLIEVVRDAKSGGGGASRGVRVCLQTTVRRTVFTPSTRRRRARVFTPSTQRRRR